MHRKQKETEQQPGTAGPGNIPGCCLVSLHFLCDIHDGFLPKLVSHPLSSAVESLFPPVAATTLRLTAEKPRPSAPAS